MGGGWPCTRHKPALSAGVQLQERTRLDRWLLWFHPGPGEGGRARRVPLGQPPALVSPSADECDAISQRFRREQEKDGRRTVRTAPLYGGCCKVGVCRG